MKQRQLIGCTAVLIALVAGARPAGAQITEARIKELIREAEKTAEQVQVRHRSMCPVRVRRSRSRWTTRCASRSSATSISPYSA